MIRQLPALIICSAIFSSPLSASTSAYVQIVDAKWPLMANRELLTPSSPMPYLINVRDVSAMRCDSKSKEPIGDIELKLKSNKKRIPLIVPLNQNSVLKIAITQSFYPIGDAVYQSAYGLAQLSCTRVLAINAKQGATYNIEMLFKGKRCELKVTDSADPLEQLKYVEYNEIGCFNEQLKFY